MEALMKIDSPLHAEHQLDQLAGQFEHWRQTRPHPSERFPPELWEHAVALASALPPSRVAKQLRLRLADLKQQMAPPHPATAAPSPMSLGFVEVPSAPSWPPPMGATQIELSRADGTRLCMHAPMATLPLEALVRAFVEGRSGSSSPPKVGSFWPPNPSISAKA